MHAVVLMFLLAPGASPQQAVADPPRPESVLDSPVGGLDYACAHRGSVATDLRHAMSRPLRCWLPYACHSDYEPGTLRDPVESWFKHTYLAYRGNYYASGYDYRRQFDYPWHSAPCRPVGFAPCRAEPPQGEEVPAPPPERVGRRPGMPRVIPGR